jgi:YtkA-like
MLFKAKNAAAAALIALASMTAAPAWASIQDYEFKLVQTDVKKADSTEIAVRLIDKRIGKPVPNAVIFAQRIDMEPDGMESMTSTIDSVRSAEPGLYRFKINLPMAGGWRLSLGAKVQGETGTLETKLPFKAVP